MAKFQDVKIFKEKRDIQIQGIQDFSFEENLFIQFSLSCWFDFTNIVKASCQFCGLGIFILLFLRKSETICVT